jgi:hypothetical protein
MNGVKGIFYALVGFVLLVACEPVENSYISDTYLLDIYKVNNNTSLTAEFGDTSLFVSNFSEFKLKPGDRACLYLQSHLDAYNSKNNSLRIVDVVEENGTRLYRTKGDANEFADGSLVDPARIIGTPVISIPFLGFLLTYIQRPPGMYVAISIGAALLLLVFLPDLLFSDGKKKS